MCQILPFTLPCCRRMYVEVSKLPSCPDTWPGKKCPPELCIQVRGYDAEDRDAGTCWRCQAQRSGVVGKERENLRPEIDRAMIVHGLDEVGVTGRRRIAEESGKCWYCGATANCEHCGVAVKVEAEEEKSDNYGKKRRRDDGGNKDYAMNKRIKVEPRDENQLPTTAFSYPDPEHSSPWQHVVPTPYNIMPFPEGYGHMQGGSMTGFGLPWAQPLPPQAVVPGTASIDWAAVNQENDPQIGPEQGFGQDYIGSAPFLNRDPYQSQYLPGTGPDMQRRPQVRILPMNLTARHNKLQTGFENPLQMEDAQVTGLWDGYGNQKPEIVRQLAQREPHLLPQNVDHEGHEDKQCTKVEQLLPGS